MSECVLQPPQRIEEWLAQHTARIHFHKCCSSLVPFPPFSVFPAPAPERIGFIFLYAGFLWFCHVSSLPCVWLIWLLLNRRLALLTQWALRRVCVSAFLSACVWSESVRRMPGHWGQARVGRSVRKPPPPAPFLHPAEREREKESKRIKRIVHN